MPHAAAPGRPHREHLVDRRQEFSVPHLVPYSASKSRSRTLGGPAHRAGAPEHRRDDGVPGLMRTGSPVNAMFKGQRPQEYAWFAISDSLPLASISPERAPGKSSRVPLRRRRAGHHDAGEAGVLARNAAPELFADAMALINQLLPGPSTRNGDVAREGRESGIGAAGRQRR